MKWILFGAVYLFVCWVVACVIIRSAGILIYDLPNNAMSPLMVSIEGVIAVAGYLAFQEIRRRRKSSQPNA
jgi:hypothetical protein